MLLSVSSVVAARRGILVGMVWVGIWLSLGAYGNAGEAIKIAYPEFQPFFAENEKGEVQGFFYDIVTQALEQRLGIATTWTNLPWKRCQEYVRSGDFDAMITVPTQERSAYSETHPDPFYLKELKLFTYAGHARLPEIAAIRTPADIKNGGFSVITYSGNGWHQKHVASLGVLTHETPIVRNVWRMLAAKRGDLVIEWPQGAYPDIRDLGLEDRIVETNVSLEAMPFHLMISKKSNYLEILPDFNTAIKAMQADGTMDGILHRYFGTDHLSGPQR